MKIPSLLTACLVSLLIGSSAGASQRPRLPEPGVDRELLQGMSPREFFEKRLARCGKLADLREDLERERESLAELIRSGGDADSREARAKRVDEARTRWLDKAAECGPCAMRPIRNQRVTHAGRTENWYVSDGSCWLPGLSQTEKLKGYEARRDALKQVDFYRGSGFRQVLEFLPVDHATGRTLPLETLPSPYHGFIAVRGPNLFSVQTAAGYYFQGTSREWQADGETHFITRFSAVRPPRRFRSPSVRFRDTAGKAHTARLMQLNDAQGQWYLSSDGYLRYHTAADFGFSLKFINGLAEEILIETLMDLLEHGRP